MSEKPAILVRLISQIRAQGKPAADAERIAISALQKSGNLYKGTTTATPKGVKRGAMTPGARAKDRAAKLSGGKAGDYKYNAATNRATKK